jgi:hypothetical protein
MHADAWAHGHEKYWASNNTSAVFDAVADIEAVFAKL